MADAPADPRVWCVLIHQLPPKPLYLRAKVRRRLARVGALAIKNSVYVLPGSAEAREDLQWIAQEATAGGGEACVCRATFDSGLSDAQLVERFRADAAARYDALRPHLERFLQQQRRAGEPSAAAAALLLRLRRQIKDLEATDFFGADGRGEVEALMTAIEQLRQRRDGATAAAGHRGTGPGDLSGRVWVTREDPHVDRLASAWLVRRFIDPAARFRFVDPAAPAVRAAEITFDMVGAAFGHEGDRCTFETIVARVGLRDPALDQIGEIVHDIDLKDGKFGRPDAAGVQQLIVGLTAAHADSAARLDAGVPLFDAL